MGKVVQAEDYIIVFTASWDTFEDTLLFFHSDLQEALLREPGRLPRSGRALGVHVSQLNDALSCNEYFVVQNGAIHPARSCETIRPALVHLLHFGEDREIATHRRLARRFETAGIALVNPYSQAVAHCDSKYRMTEVLRRRRVPTPATRFISRFTKDKVDALERIRQEFRAKDLYLQPDRGTEGKGCVYLERDKPTLAEQRELYADHDLIIRERVGNLDYDGHDFVMRINVTYDGKTFLAESGYCMVGGRIVSAAAGAVKVSVNKVLGQLRLRPREIDRIKATACAALQALSEGSVPPRLAGVDLVLERQIVLTAYVIDINPRPAVVGSRMIGSDAIGLGDHFWNGIRDLQRTGQG